MSDKPVKMLEDLTRRHGVRAMTPATVEVFALALGDVIGHRSVLSASKMDKMTVGFVESLEKAEELVAKGIVIGGESVPVLPLSTAAKKVTVSNAPPYLKEVQLRRLLSRYGEIVSPIENVPISSSSPLIQHVKSFRRSVYMIVPNNGELELTLRFNEYGIDHNVYISTDKMRCFKCGETSHKVRNCPRNQSAKNHVTPRNQSESVNDDVTPAEATGESAAEVKEAVGDAGEGGAAEVKEAVAAVVEEMLEKVEQEVKKRNKKAKGKKTQPEPSSDVTTEMMDISPPAEEPEAPKERTTGSKDSVKKRKMESPAPEEKIETESDDSNDEEYSRSYIKYFLRETKYEKGVNIRKYFPDLRLFVKNCKEYMADNRFEDTEVYRLKKIVKKVNDVLKIENG